MSTERQIPNPALEPLSVLIGEWNTAGSHPLVPGATLRGRASVEWLEGGAFIIMRAEIDDPRFPKTVAIIGSDDATGECYMLTFDDRGVSRKYDMSFSDTVWRWWRDAPDSCSATRPRSPGTGGPWSGRASSRRTVRAGSAIST